MNTPQDKTAQLAAQFTSSGEVAVADAHGKYADFVNSRAKVLSTHVQDILHAAVGVAGEGGELLDGIKKCWIYNKEVDEQVVANLMEEAGDALFYIQHLCNVIGCTLQDLINGNIEKLCKRYPHGYSDAAALERADKKV